jgi:hypothetical protein
MRIKNTLDWTRFSLVIVKPPVRGRAYCADFRKADYGENNDIHLGVEKQRSSRSRNFWLQKRHAYTVHIWSRETSKRRRVW